MRAQIERALETGLNIDYLDYHMSTAVDKPESRKIVEKLAHEYQLGISRYFGEIDTEKFYDDPIDSKLDSLIRIVSELEATKINLLVGHIGMDNPELRAMLDLNPFGLEQMSKHRYAELEALTSSDFSDLIKDKNVKLLTYKDVIDRWGLSIMKRPIETDSY